MAETEYRQHRYARPPGATEVFLVRHGESAAVVPGVAVPQADGHDDPALAPQGRDQAERVFRWHHIPRVCSGPCDARLR